MNKINNKVKKVVVEEVVVEEKATEVSVCSNCDNSGRYCSVCSNPTVE